MDNEHTTDVDQQQVAKEQPAETKSKPVTFVGRKHSPVMVSLKERKKHDLTPKELKFCHAFADPESESYGLATESAKAAGYSQPHTAAWKLRRRENVQRYLGKLYEHTFAAVARVMSDIEHERLLAIKKGDISSALRASELQGKRLGAFIESQQLIVEHQHVMAEVSQREAQKLARAMLMLEDEQAEADAESVQGETVQHPIVDGVATVADLDDDGEPVDD
jgi:phage terminase small subunit